ncbi:hypothetical protein DDD_1388 [Nonlabens dokdonensis DSW-6]|uniref:Uncharacterized protein n=1 Tax=Nonlabens dokdonensis (strain DSM 17205 / KCTC 12402 / DSW-6) TaxID=592029 RepID=L7W4I2_NONDD|nr:hypothetical protein DDD_1388 [Nonlabens dokdonensis DSW-6]
MLLQLSVGSNSNTRVAAYFFVVLSLSRKRIIKSDFSH